MSYKFPGMDPYLEDRAIWRGFHHRLADEIADILTPHIGPKYYADIDVTTTFEEVNIGKPRIVLPDVGIMTQPAEAETTVTRTLVAEPAIAQAPIQRSAAVVPVKLRSVHIYVTESDELVTTIEILSPANKRGDGLSRYRRKRTSLLSSAVHLVEIDLLRGGQRVGGELQDPPLDDVDYIFLVNRGIDVNPDFISEIWPATLDQPLPAIPIPLLPPDPDVGLNMNAVIQAVYQRAGYAWRIDYSQPVPPPALRPALEEWLRENPLHRTEDGTQ